MPPLCAKSKRQIVPASPQALATRSAALAARGLRDLSRDSNWLIKKIFSDHTSHLAISPTGQLCASSPLQRAGTERIALYDIELGEGNITLSVPGEPQVSAPGMLAAFAWSSTGRYLVAAWPGRGERLHAFDLYSKSPVGRFGGFSEFPRSLAWSDPGRYFACGSGDGAEARLRLWEKAPDSQSAVAFLDPPLSEAGGTRSFEKCFGAEWAERESGDEGAFTRFGRIAFSPDESALATVLEMEGEWADDSIAVLDVPTLRRLRVFPAQGHITGLAWTFDSRSLLYCSGGQAYRLTSESLVSESLPFGGELVTCHPHLRLCLCFSSWLKNSAKGRLFVANLNTLSTEDEYPAEGLVDLRWSYDGLKAYAVTADGLAYIYELPPL